MEEEFHNHMRIPWHDYTRKSIGRPITEASLSEKASIIGRTGIMLLSCGTGAWRVRSSMNTLARELGITCTADIGLLSIEYTCIDGGNCYTESLCLFNTGVNTSKLYRMEEFVNKFAGNCKKMSGDELHTLLDRIHEIHGFYSPPFLGLAAAVACCAFTFLLGGGPVEMFCCSGMHCIHNCIYGIEIWISCFDPPSGWLYLFHVIYHSRISIYHKWN